MSKPVFDLTGKSVLVSGHHRMADSALVRRSAAVDHEVVTPWPDHCDLAGIAATKVLITAGAGHALADVV